MTQQQRRSLATALIAVVGAVVTGCGSADNGTSPITLKSPTTSYLVGTIVTATPNPEPTKIKLCKIGNVDGTFTITATGGSPSVIVSPVTVAAGTCVEVVDNAVDAQANVTITETSAGLVSDTARLNAVPGSVGTVQTYTDGVTPLNVNTFHGWTVVYVNFVAPPASTQGCSPGYWKNHTAAGKWPSPYTPGTTFSSVFGATNNPFGTKTLLQVLQTGGGGITALGRQTVSALLNAQALGAANFGIDAATVISDFDAVYPGTSAAQQTLQTYFESLTDVNGRVCPLN